MGDWEHPYLTFNPEYEAGIIEGVWQTRGERVSIGA